jgi:hypothetical protein
VRGVDPAGHLREFARPRNDPYRAGSSATALATFRTANRRTSFDDALHRCITVKHPHHRLPIVPPRFLRLLCEEVGHGLFQAGHTGGKRCGCHANTMHRDAGMEIEISHRPPRPASTKVLICRIGFRTEGKRGIAGGRRAHAGVVEKRTRTAFVVPAPPRLRLTTAQHVVSIRERVLRQRPVHRRQAARPRDRAR